MYCREFNRGLLLISSTALSLFISATTRAAPCDLANDPARARSLFERAKATHMQARNDDGPPTTFEPACQLFEESLRLHRIPLTLLYLAHCRKDQGKPATAYARYKEARTLAISMNDNDIAQEAEEKAELVKDLRSFLELRVDQRPPGLKIALDDKAVSQAELNAPIPVDGGTHNVTLNLEGHWPANMAVPTMEPRETRILKLSIRDLKRMPPAPPRDIPNAETRSSSPWAWALGSAGATAVVVGGVTGILAQHDNNTIDSRCHDKSPCSDVVAMEIQRRRNFERGIAWATIPVGIAAVGAAITWIIAERQSTQRAAPDMISNRLSASVDAHGGIFSFSGVY